MVAGSGLGRYRAHLTLRKYPRRGLGAPVNAGGIAASGAGVATTAIASSSAFSGTWVGAAAGPIGAAVGLVVGVIAALWSAHEARAKGATTENQFLNSAVTAFDGSLKAIFQAANAGQISASDAISMLGSLMPTFWASVANYQHLPGTADASHGGVNCGTYIPGQTTPCTPSGAPACNKSCTASCCVGCHDFMPTVQYAAYIFSQPNGGSLNVCEVYGDHYGLNDRAQYTLTYTPPAGSGGAVASALGLSGSTVLGIPTWLLALAGGGALLWYATQ
jgi:hypothetical protein